MTIRNRTKVQKLSLAAAVFSILEAAASSRSTAATLPVPCAPGSCGTWVTSGTAGAVQFGNNLTVNQTSDRAIFNWQSFNISADGSVTFKQPDSNSIALNRIFDKNPSEILGKLEANGQVYLYNQNGFLFGATARVNTGGLLASSLNIKDDIFGSGLLSATPLGRAAMEIETAGVTGNIIVEPGAQLITNSAGQRIMLAANKIDNQGNITANDGQVILAAGEKVYLSASDDPKLRGLLVEVDSGGTVNNTGVVTAERGNITAVGLAINQNGRMTATTSVSANGSIRLLARDTAGPVQDDRGRITRVASRGGELQLGSGSVTEIKPDVGDKTTAVDEQKQFLSSIELVGKTVELAGGSSVLAKGGELSVIAAAKLDIARDDGRADPEARIRVDTGALIDLSGNTANASVTRNLVTVELRANELADSPEQRDGALRGKSVVVDARVVTPNGNHGTDIGNVQGAIDLIGHDVLERTAQGGTATFDSAGDIVVAKNAVIDVSGGAVNYEGGMMRTSLAIKADGTLVDIGKVNKDERYVGLLNPVYKSVFDRWGVVKYISAPGLNNYEPGYVEGADAGTIQFMSNAMVLAGNFIGNATNGINQRTKETMALGGQLIVGTASPTSALTSFRAPTINIVSSAVPVVVGQGTSLPAGLPMYLSTDFISQGGFSRVQFASDDRIVVAADTPIDLFAGGSIAMVAPRVEINSDITVSAGSIKANAINNGNGASNYQAGLFIGDHVSLDVRGRWVNDAVVPLDQLPTELILTKGGDITLSQSTFNGTLAIGDDVALRASGGAWLKRSSTISGGAGGSIALGSASNIGTGEQKTILGENLQIEGYGVQGAAGGSFTLRAPRLEIAGSDTWLSAQQVSTSTTQGDALRVGAPLFSDFGFANVSLTADNLPLLADTTKTALAVRAGAHIDLAPQTLLLSDAAMSQASAVNIAGFTSAADPLEHQTRSGSLRLQALTTLPNPQAHGGVVVESGVTITGNADSALNLVSSGNLRFGGTIDIASGSVDMRIVEATGDGVDKTFVDRQLTLDSTAKIDLSGTTILRPNELELRQGSVLDGGRIALVAERGSVNTKNGSLIDVSGTQSELDTKQPGATEYVRRAVSTAAGSVSVQAEETIAMQGDLLAWGGTSGGANNTGGSLSVALTRNLPAGAFGITYPKGPRVVQVVNDASAIDDTLVGIASIDARIVAQSGIESLLLQSDDRVAIGAGVDLHLNRSVDLNAPQIAVLGTGTASVTASNLAIGSDLSPNSLLTASSGTGALQLNGDQITFRRLIALQNIHQTNVSSSGDIQFSSYQTPAQSFNLTTSGNLTLRAQRVLPTTRSQYIVKATGSDSIVTIEQSGSSPGTPLSVAGSLTITAPNIVQGGTLVAPFGSLELNATNSLRLLSGSYTSVSGGNAVLPYGRVDNGNSWVWGVDSNNTNPIDSLAQPRVVLNGTAPSGVVPTSATGADIDMAAGAVVDISGGGNLLAYQYTPGTGGKQDVLDPESAGYLKDTYVIVPGLAGQSTGYDPMLWQASDLTPGQSVFIAEGSDVPAGVYQLLPTRYAFVPGAYLVTAVSGYQDLATGNTATTSDGAQLVAGYYTFGDKQNAAARNSGFVVRPGSYARKLAQYEDRLATTFFTARAEEAGARATLPSDAGSLVVAVDKSLSALATVRGQGAAGGRNATVEIAASGIGSTIEIDGATTNANTGAGVVHLASSTLKSWNIGSLLLGGSSNAMDAVNVQTENIVVHSGASLSADEVVLVASKAINVEAGASVGSTSDSQPGVSIDATRLSESTSLKLAGANAASAAVLAVSDLNYLVTERGVTQSNTGATVTVASGAHVGTRGAVAVDSSGVISLATNSIAADGASWSLGATHVAFGDASTAADGLAIDNSLQANLQTARAINLSSAQTLDITRSVELGSATTESITLKTAGIQNTAANTNSVFTAKDIVLNGVNAQSNTVAQGTGGIAFNAQRIELGKGETGLSGFESASLNATGVIIGTDIGGLVTAGNLSISSAAITADSGAQTTLKAEQGAISLTAVGAAPDPTTLKTGGTLAINGRDIDDAARIIAPSGVVSLHASNSLNVRAGATIDVAGYRPPLAATGSNGGAVTLEANGLTVASGTTINVSAGPQADAGSIKVIAGATNLAGTMIGAADGGYDGGEFTVDAQSLTDFAALNRTLEVGGFTERRSYRVRTGSITLAASDRITAQQIELTADAGSVVVNGRMLAASGEQRSSIAVNAGSNVVIGGTAVLDASAVEVSKRGGSIELASTGGLIQIASTASIRATGVKQSGSLTLRAPATASDFNLDSLPADLSKVDNVILQPIFSATLTDNPTSADFNVIGTRLGAYVSGARTTILNRLDLNAANNVYLRPYADLTRVGDLTLEMQSNSLSEFDFASNTNAWRFAGQPAVVSIRATGNLTIASKLTDGFSAIQSGDLLGTTSNPQYSSAFNFVAGADLTSASMTATERNSVADLSLSDEVVVRTGTGDISLAAARDIVMGAGSTIYTGGIPGANTLIDDDGTNIYPDKGGSIRISAGRDVSGSVVQQAVGGWQTRWSNWEESPRQVRSAYWGVDVSRFGWHVGALGGGDVSIAAGRNATDISAAVVDTAADSAGTRLLLGGSNLSVTTGGDIESGYFYVAHGLGDLVARGAFSASGNRPSAPAAGTLLIAGDASYKLAATGDILFEGEGQASVFSPIWPSLLTDSYIYFSRYSADSSLAVQSSGGAIDFSTGGSSTFADFGLESGHAFILYPASVQLSAFGGDFNLHGDFLASPSATSGLSIYAARDIAVVGNGIAMSDVATASLQGASATNVAGNDAGGSNFAASFSDNTNVVLHVNDDKPSTFSAGRDINDLTLRLAEAVEVQAGRDIKNLSLDLQQAGVSTVSKISVGRDFYYTYTPDALTHQIRVGGSGLLELLAGRNIDLAFSLGITTSGDLLNGNLPTDDGASIFAIAGLSQPLGTGEFVADIVDADADLKLKFVTYVEQQTSRQNLDFDTARTLYSTLPTTRQLPFAIDALFQELVASGREATGGSPAGYSRGFEALASIFPNKPNDDDSYAGDISLPFSRIYTLDGGSITLMAPDGKIDVGLANTPSLANVNSDNRAELDRRKASLGIVAQQAGEVHILADGDVLVNSSRIFTLGGGDIAIWSSTGNIDAGKGAKSAITAPPPTLTIDAAGNVKIDPGSAIAGSGIRTIRTNANTSAANVDLMAPTGFVNAGDAGIGSTGNLNIAAQSVVGLDNIEVGGKSSGVPAETGGLGASLSGVTATAGNATTNAANSIGDGQAAEKTSTVLADAAMSWLEVFVVGLGEDNCKQDDIECLKRQK